MSISDIIALLSGIALFLFGMSLMGDGLKKVSGNKLEPILFRLSGTPARGIALGAGVTAVIQSSSATSVMMVGFVNSGLMKVRQAISVILGAILGTSITGWVICLGYIDSGSGLSSLLSTSTLTGIIAVIGIILRMFGKKRVHKNIGDIMMGFAVLMFGMSTMSGAVSGLGEQPWFKGLLSTMTQPIVGIMVGLLFSALLQSASAAVGIVQAMSVTGAMTLGSALPLLMGITIGAALPVLLSALGANTAGKRTAISYLVASFMGVMVCASLFYIADAMFRFSFLKMTMDPFSTALTNTVLRLAILALLAPFLDVLEAVSVSLVPERNAEADPALRLEERFLSHPALAIEQSRLTICEMAGKTEEAMKAAAKLLSAYSEAGFEYVQKLEAEGDRYEDALGTYLVKLTGRDLSDSQGKATSVFLHTLSDFERISDHARNIARSANEIHEKKMSFSEDAQHELSVMAAAVLETMKITRKAFDTNDLVLASQVEPLEEVVDDLSDELKLRHVERLQKGRCTIANGFVFNDLITNFERVSDQCSNIAVAMIELSSGSFETHEYLDEVKEERSRDYERWLQTYKAKFALN
ncbi:MAG: Na/Pi cotransporter family protein [Oscillospiraceae bacterium]|nr:Na/Pi cotransporter family protein [Oscillospiraceae bacterium]